MITVNFPESFCDVVAHTITVDDRVSTVGELLILLTKSRPLLAAELADPLYNIAVNDEILLHDVARHPIADGDVVEIVPTMAGG